MQLLSLTHKFQLKTLVFSTLFLLSCKSVKYSANLHVDELRERVQTADKLTIVDQTKNVVFQSNAKHLSELASLFEIKEMDNGHDCLCYADFVLIFYKNGQYDFALGLHPEMGLRWTNSPWLSDGLLDDFAYFLILDWIKTEIQSSKILENYEIPEVLSEEQ